MPVSIAAGTTMKSANASPYHASSDTAQEVIIPDAATKVAMLVFNPCVTDSRVIRQAEALAQAGYDVTVIARRALGIPIHEVRNGVKYRRVIGPVDRWYPWPRRAARLANHFRRAPYALNASNRLFGRAIVTFNAPRRITPDVRNQATPGGMKSAEDKAPPADPAGRITRRIAHARAKIAGRVMGLRTKVARRIASLKNKATRRAKKAKSKISRAVMSRVLPKFNNLIVSAFIFEVIEVAMRRQLLGLKPDIIHAHDLMTLPTASRAASSLGARLIYDSHELEMHRNANYSRYAWHRRGRMERRHIKRTDLVITVSDSIADHLRDVYRIPRPQVILNAPPYRSADLSTDVSVRRTLDLPPKTPLAIYVGGVTINRGIEMCVRALVHYPELHFATVGPRRKQNEIELLELADHEGVSDRFHMIDAVASDAVVPFVRDADVSVLPIQNVCLSYYYCMPNKLFESVIGGLPVAVADLVELRRFVERYRCGVIMDERDPQDVARAMRQVIENREKYVLGEEAISEVRIKYTWPAQAALLVKAYGNLKGNVATIPNSA